MSVWSLSFEDLQFIANRGCDNVEKHTFRWLSFLEESAPACILSEESSAPSAIAMLVKRKDRPRIAKGVAGISDILLSPSLLRCRHNAPKRCLSRDDLCAQVESTPRRRAERLKSI